MIGDFSESLKDIVVWDKGHGQPAMQQGVLNRRSELVLVFEDPEQAISRQFKRCFFERGTLSDVWEVSRGAKVDSSHGAVFPERLVSLILENFSGPGDVVYDPFLGSGTTAKVANELGRSYIGSEISESYCELARKRILGLL